MDLKNDLAQGLNRVHRFRVQGQGSPNPNGRGVWGSVYEGIGVVYSSLTLLHCW